MEGEGGAGRVLFGPRGKMRVGIRCRPLDHVSDTLVSSLWPGTVSGAIP